MEVLKNYTVNTSVSCVYWYYNNLCISDDKGQEIEISDVKLSQMILCFRNLFCGKPSPELEELTARDKEFIKETVSSLQKYIKD